MSTLIGLYDDLSTGEQVVQNLENNGFSRENMHLATHVNREQRQSGGFLDSLRDLFGSGPRYTGDQPQDLAPQLKSWGVPEQEAMHFAEAVRRGSTLILVDAPDDRSDDARQIMDSYGPIDIQERSQAWRQQGWQGYDRTARPYTAEETQRERAKFGQGVDQGGETTIPVTEERLRTGKRQVQRGGVGVYRRVTEKPAEETVNLCDETVDVQRRPVDRPASPEDMQAFQEGSFDVTETDEEAVVDKEARVVEEVTVRKDVQERPETVRDTVRRTEVETRDLGQGARTSDFDTVEPAFRRHYQTTYSNAGYDYNQFEPAYRYGYDFANSGQYGGQDWSSVENDIRASWEQDHPDQSWDQFGEAVHQGWQQASG
jgi:uncharacterized protein (TIGR02271 family)